jgi:hypothetical protein
LQRASPDLPATLAPPAPASHRQGGGPADARGKMLFEGVSEKQAQRILDLLMRHANDIAVTLTQFPQYYRFS